MHPLRPPSADRDPPIGFCPYVGLDAYTESDSDYFFGRERDQRVIAANLYASRLTILYGASGVGKTSVLLAGLIPRLRATPHTAVVLFRDWQTSGFADALKTECVKAVDRVVDEPVAVEANRPLDDLLLELGRSLRGRFVLLFDQFEEYFLYHPEARADGLPSFDAELARVVNREEVDASFLIVLREEGLASLDRFRVRIPNLLGNRLRLRHLDRTAANDAIRKPLDVYNQRVVDVSRRVTIDDDLVEAVIADVRTGRDLLGGTAGALPGAEHRNGAQIETPFLQIVMTRLWEEPETTTSGVLRLGAYQRLGRAERIVRAHLQLALQGLSRGDQEVAARAFRYLVTPSRTKIAYTVTDLAQFTGLTRERLSAVLHRLAQGRIRILREVEPNAPVSDEPAEIRYEVFHDVLAPAIQEWQRQFTAVAERNRQIRRRAGAAVLALGIVAFAIVVYVNWWEPMQPWGYLQNVATGETHDLKGSLIRIGRSVPGIQNDVSLVPQNISRIHAMIFRDLSMIDGRSLYGTTVNARFLPYGGTAKLRDGDVIALSGEAALTFSSKPLHSEPMYSAGIVVDGTHRKITPLSSGRNFLKIDDQNNLTISQEDPGNATMVVQVDPAGNLSERISIQANVQDDVTFDAKIDDYNYNSYKIPAGRQYTYFPIRDAQEPPFASRVVYHYHDLAFQLVDIVGH